MDCYYTIRWGVRASSCCTVGVFVCIVTCIVTCTFPSTSAAHISPRKSCASSDEDHALGALDSRAEFVGWVERRCPQHEPASVPNYTAEATLSILIVHAGEAATPGTHVKTCSHEMTITTSVPRPEQRKCNSSATCC